MSKEMWIEERSAEEIAADVSTIRESKEFEKFPVARGTSASIVTQIFKELRNTKAHTEARRTRKSDSSVASSLTTTDSTSGFSIVSSATLDSMKRPRDGDSDAQDADEELGNPRAHSRRRARS